MTGDQWLAIDAVTPPALRARELRREWEQFVSGGAADGIRTPVADSWRRSLDAGVDPSGSRLAPLAADRAEASELWEAHPLAAAAPLIRDCLTNVARESDHLLVVSDADGVLLQLDGDARVRSQAADSMNFTEGALWSEGGAGTNAVGTALAADHAVQVFATEHFMEVVQAWTCSAAPVHDPETGELLGVIDLTGLQKNVHPQSLAVVMTTARAVEGHLRYRVQERDNRLRARYRQHISGVGDRRALVSPSGRVVADDPRAWLRRTRLHLPPGGGELVLPSGARAVAEPVGQAEGFVVRELDRQGGPRRAPGDELRRLAGEQAALRRLATAVARGVSPAEMFAAVADEMAPLLGADESAIVRFECDATATFVAGVGQWVDELGLGVRAKLDDSLVITSVFHTGRPTRADRQDYNGASGVLVDYLRRKRYRSMVASPIVVDGRRWGAMVLATLSNPLPPDTEERLTNVNELVGMVIANAESRAELTASRARVVAAADEARRRIQRDLHDGAQQRLVTTVMALKLARQQLGDQSGPVLELLDEALQHAEGANGQLRELAHGILPSALTHGGLRGAIGGLVSGVHLPVSVDVTAERLPDALEAAAYFIVAEALTNAVRHANAHHVEIVALVGDGVLRLEVRDDGVGGARYEGSSGLLGLRDRAAALDGDLWVESPPGSGTTVRAMLPIPVSQAA